MNCGTTIGDKCTVIIDGSNVKIIGDPITLCGEVVHIQSPERCQICECEITEFKKWKCKRGPETGRERIICYDCIFEFVDYSLTKQESKKFT